MACFDCHVNGHTNAATHLVGDIRPQEFRHRLDTPSLRGVNIQRLFGSQRALKSVEDFTEFEQRAAYFDGDPVIATKKGVNILERGSQVHFMAEFQDAARLPAGAEAERLRHARPEEGDRGGAARPEGVLRQGACARLPPGAVLHRQPACTTCRRSGSSSRRWSTAAWPPATARSRRSCSAGIKDSPPYLHDGRLLTLEDTVEFFNLVLETKLTDQEKQDLVAFMRCL